MKSYESTVSDLLKAAEDNARIAADVKRIIELGRIYRQALVTLATHDFTSVPGCRRGQVIAAKALRGET